MKEISIEVINSTYTLIYYINFLNRKQIINSKEFPEFFEVNSTNAVDFLLKFLEKFAKFKKLERNKKVGSTPKQAIEIVYELEEDREEQLYFLFKFFGGYKRKIYQNLMELLEKSEKSFDEEMEKLVKEVVVKNI